MTSASRAGLMQALAAVERAPASADAWCALGTAFLGQGNFQGAVEALARAVKLGPDHATAWAHLGLARRRTGDHRGGCSALQHATTLAPDDPTVWGNLSAAHESCGDAEAAVLAAKRAIMLAPDHAGWHASLGTALRSAGRVEEALVAFDAAAVLDPHDVRIPWNRALTLLSAHDFRRGLPAYEVRQHRVQHRPIPQPRWDDGPVPSDGVIVHHEQGLGDTVQWARFLPTLARHTRNVVVAAPARLHRLLGSISGVSATITRAEAHAHGTLQARSCSAHVGLMSLGDRLGATGDTLAENLPLLRTDDAVVRRWRRQLGDGRPVVALTWQGNPAYERDHLRSPPLAAFAPVLSRSDVCFVSLQKFHGAEQLQSGHSGIPSIVDLGKQLDLGPDAFVDTAAVMSAVDLVITSDTSTAHLAGTLGRPTWMVLSRPCDWRWGHLEQETPWYPTMRLFRQPTPGNWAAVFRNVATALESWISASPQAGSLGRNPRSAE